MNKLFLISRSICVAMALLLFFSCGEIIPTIIFTIPQNKQEYFKDRDIEVQIIIADTKGKTFPVQLYVDDIFFDELLVSPYFFRIDAGKIFPGEHIIKVTTKGAEAFRIINIKDLNSESENFVTFTNGVIPSEWTVHNWRISTSDGVDDNFSLSTFMPEAQVTTSKKCNNISFYMKGYGTIYLYKDANKDLIPWQTIILGNNSIPQSWTHYQFACDNGYHTFTWLLINGSIGLDAIRFNN